VAILVNYRQKCFKEKKNLLIRLDIANSKQNLNTWKKKNIPFSLTFLHKHVLLLAFSLAAVTQCFCVLLGRGVAWHWFQLNAKCCRFNFSYPVHCIKYIWPKCMANVWFIEGKGHGCLLLLWTQSKRHVF
jgi:hypothetical protein